jgi:hypothetical protein
LEKENRMTNWFGQQENDSRKRQFTYLLTYSFSVFM